MVSGLATGLPDHLKDAPPGLFDGCVGHNAVPAVRLVGRADVAAERLCSTGLETDEPNRPHDPHARKTPTYITARGERPGRSGASWA
ncbi:MAG: hypothetical protein NVS4B6_31240 [Mycobacterium sp.]